MPFGKKGRGAAGIDFDLVYEAMQAAIERAGLESLRADYDPGGGFIHRSMFEALMVAECVVVDLTFANSNVAYEVGLRHGANAGRGTLLVCEQGSLKKLPFDFRPFRTIPYELAKLDALGAVLGERLALALQGALPVDNPILQVTNLRPSVVGHEKTDLFSARMALVGDLGARVRGILDGQDGARAIEELQRLQAEIVASAAQIEQLHTVLLAIYLGYRAKEAWAEMVALYEAMPRELQESPVAREQLALAHNRIAEATKDDAAIVAARRRALDALAQIPLERWTSETFGILGRIHKGRASSETAAGRAAEARGALTEAIKAYEAGFRADPRDYFPGINAVTLRILRDGAAAEEALRNLVPVVRFSVARAPTPTRDDERYWQAATKLELAAAARDWGAAATALDDALGIVVDGWMRKTTADNLARQAYARAAEPETVRALGGFIGALVPGRAP